MTKDGYLIILLSSEIMFQLMKYCNNNLNLTNELENGKNPSLTHVSS